MQEALRFIFELGIVFSIFGFIWGVLQFVFKRILGAGSRSSEVSTYVLRITKYFFLVSVAASSVWFKFEKHVLVEQDLNQFYMVLSTVVLALYLIGKLQKRNMMAQLGNNPMLQNLITKIDPKVERFLLLGSLLYFIACIMRPEMVTNGVIIWFREVIYSIQNAFLIGWIFYIAAFVFLITIFLRAINMIQNILAGKSPFDGPSMKGGGFKGFGTQFGQDGEDNNTIDVDDEGFTDYEDVTDQEDK